MGTIVRALSFLTLQLGMHCVTLCVTELRIAVYRACGMALMHFCIIKTIYTEVSRQ